MGNISNSVSKITGLSTKTSLSAGGGDQQCGVVGAGAVRQGMGTMTVGTAGFLISFLEKPVTGPDFISMMSVGSAVPGKYEIEGIQLGSGVVLKWFRDNLGNFEKIIAEQLNKNSFAILDEYADKSPVGAKGLIVLPYLGSAGCPSWNVDAKGVIAGLTFSHTKEDIVRAFMEGIILEMRDIYETMRKANINFEELIITGGAAKSPVWRQIMADILGTRMKRLAVSDATVLGAAILGGYGAGLFSSVQEGAELLVKYKDIVEPDTDNIKKYNEIYSLYADLYRVLNSSDIFQKFSKLSII